MALASPGHRVRYVVRGRALTDAAPPERQAWLDWARGLAAVMMVLAHVVDAWTRNTDRERALFYCARFIGGLAGPAFLFLAGLGIALSGAARIRRGATPQAATDALARRGWQVFGLAFVFRVQALALGWGSPIDFFKVDVLNVMGPAMVVAARLWGAAATAAGRVAVAGLATFAIAMAAPLLQSSALAAQLPAPFRWYIVPTPGHTNFTLFPWMAFVFAGVAAGAALADAGDERRQRRLILALAVFAVGGTVGAYWASLQPTIYPAGTSMFWEASPTFFFLRLGLVVALLPLMWGLRRHMPARVGGGLQTLGAASLFVYWVHVEMVYGGIAIPFKHRVPIELTIVGSAALIYGLTRLVAAARTWVSALDRPPVRVKRLVARLL